MTFGIWAVDELQICEMGSWAPEGRTREPPVVIFDQTCNVPNEGHESREEQEIVYLRLDDT